MSVRVCTRAAMAVGIANVQPRLDELYTLASYACPSPILKRTYSRLDTLVRAVRRAVTVHWRRRCAGSEEAPVASMRWQW